MSEQDDAEREFDLKWADKAEHKEPSARARMLAERWKKNPPGPVPFRADPGPVRSRRRSSRIRSRPRSSRIRSGRRSSWISTAIVLGSMAAIILLLGYLNFRPSY
ncbi:hypothetical protein [Streptomyces sp. GESEQ-35]|uniref:SCO2583/SCO2584 N-terminal domain-containing protein n=1 Tax=Streptomyces sp. GESEQ-35 TaxID=2812657 RepID=UPI001B3434A4|nr:hypothetical protein [Streptomyces sp. GESEQ-35]